MYDKFAVYLEAEKSKKTRKFNVGAFFKCFGDMMVGNISPTRHSTHSIFSHGPIGYPTLVFLFLAGLHILIFVLGSHAPQPYRHH